MEVNYNLQASVAAAVPENVIEILQMCMFDEKVMGDIFFFGTPNYAPPNQLPNRVVLFPV